MGFSSIRTCLPILLMLAACASAPPSAAVSHDSQLQPLSLGAAERAFAADASARTVNEAFLQVLAADAILFRQAPVNARASLAQRAMNPALLLLWTPTYAETSADGTLGFDTGPSDFGARGSPPAGHGFFVSVWRLMADGWKLVLDGGIESPAAFNLDSAARTLVTRHGTRVFQDNGGLMAVERSLIEDYRAHFSQRADEDVRAYRDESLPATTRAAATALISRDPVIEFLPVDAVVAGSGDLGYVYGTTNPRAEKPKGYLRIYRRAADGHWQIAVDWHN